MKNVAIVGFGTVGAGVGEILVNNRDIISKKTGEEINLKYICDLRDFPDSEFNKIRVSDYNVIVNDPEVDIIVEAMGGCGVAYKLTKASLEKGKSVVTPNKELVATYGDELMKLARDNNCKYLFEASVGGTIPVLRPLTQCLGANKIEKIAGILNGTTNYILTQMYTNGKSYDEALREAQALGYAEQNPDADVKGKDTCRKITILSAIMSGMLFDPNTVPTVGIDNITKTDVEAADAMGGKLKLLGVAKRTDDGEIFAEVSPYFIPKNSPICGIEDVFNGVLITGDNCGDVMFYGRGAGKLPTASAVVADIMDIVMHRADENAFLLWNKTDKKPSDNYGACSYLLVCKGETDAEDKAVLSDGSVSFITGEMNTEETEKYMSELEKSGCTVVSKYRVF